MNYLEKFRRIRTFIFDIDGVLTSGQVLITTDGALLRSMNVRDGYALHIAISNGFRVGVISGGTTPAAEERFGALGVQDVFLGVKDKLEVFEHYIKQNNLKENEILYMGDDLPDLSVMQRVGMPCCPKDSVDEIRDISAYISPKNGGNGCVRDVIEKVLKLQGCWPGYPNIKAPASKSP